MLLPHPPFQSLPGEIAETTQTWLAIQWRGHGHIHTQRGDPPTRWRFLLASLRDYDIDMYTRKFCGLLRWCWRLEIISAAVFTLLWTLLMGRPSRAQGTPLALDTRNVESATRIADSVCSNPVIGTSYQLPEEMKPEDAAALLEAAYAGSKASGIGPEARYLLYGYQEDTQYVRLCGAVSDGGRVMMIALPASLMTSQQPNTLESIVGSMAAGFRAQPPPPTVKTINGVKLLCTDVRGEVDTVAKGRTDIQATFCAATVNSYVVTWTLIGYSEPVWKHLVAGLQSIKTFAPQPLKSRPPAPPPSSSSPQEPMARDFKERFDAFLNEWLIARDTEKTMAFFDPGAYTAPPLIGTYCSAWYRPNSPPQEVAGFITPNLMGAPMGFPAQTPASAMFMAWSRFLPQWVSSSANDVAKDHFLVARLDAHSLPLIFSGIFAHSDYANFLASRSEREETGIGLSFPTERRAPTSL